VTENDGQFSVCDKVKRPADNVILTPIDSDLDTPTMEAGNEQASKSLHSENAELSNRVEPVLPISPSCPKVMPRPTHEILVFWTSPPKGGTGNLRFEKWKECVGPNNGHVIRFADLAPASTGNAFASEEDATVSTGDTSRQVGSDEKVLQVGLATADVSPSVDYKPLEEMDLKSLAELHQQMELARGQVRADLVVPGRVGGHGLAILVDSGATITVLSTRKWIQIHRDNPHLTLMSSPDTVQMASGECQPVGGRVMVELELAGQTYLHQVYVMQIQQDCILGMDFLAQYDVACDWRKGILKVRGTEVEACRRYSLGDGRLR